jgi:phosphoribosyl-AMP cyclohydrolase
MSPYESNLNKGLELVDQLKFNEQGLIPAVIQEADTKEVLMVAWMDKKALELTLETKRTWFYSRSRKTYWQKGETSGNRQFVRGVFLDCDNDVLLVSVHQEGTGACHTGERTCFFKQLL